MNIVTNEVGDVKVGDTLLPGIYQSMEITGSLRLDESNVQGQSGTSKQPLGFEDAAISLSMIIPSDEKATCYQRLEVFMALFQNTNQSGKPYVYKITNQLTIAWKIRDVLFKDLRVKDDNQRKNSLAVDITFQEYNPVVVKREKRAIPPGDLNPYTDFTKYETPVSPAKSGVESPAKDDDTI